MKHPRNTNPLLPAISSPPQKPSLPGLVKSANLPAPISAQATKTEYPLTIASVIRRPLYHLRKLVSRVVTFEERHYTKQPFRIEENVTFDTERETGSEGYTIAPYQHTGVTPNIQNGQAAHGPSRAIEGQKLKLLKS